MGAPAPASVTGSCCPRQRTGDSESHAVLGSSGHRGLKFPQGGWENAEPPAGGSRSWGARRVIVTGTQRCPSLWRGHGQALWGTCDTPLYYTNDKKPRVPLCGGAGCWRGGIRPPGGEQRLFARSGGQMPEGRQPWVPWNVSGQMDKSGQSGDFMTSLPPAGPSSRPCPRPSRPPAVHLGVLLG